MSGTCLSNDSPLLKIKDWFDLIEDNNFKVFYVVREDLKRVNNLAKKLAH